MCLWKNSVLPIVLLFGFFSRRDSVSFVFESPNKVILPLEGELGDPLLPRAIIRDSGMAGAVVLVDLPSSVDGGQGSAVDEACAEAVNICLILFVSATA